MARGMTCRWIMAAKRSGGRQRGNIEERGGALRVRLYAGTDPVTHRQVYLRSTIQGTGDAALRKAEDKLSEFRTQVLKQRTAASSVTFAYAIDEWLRTSEIEASTRKTYVGYIANHIKPALGAIPVKKLDVRTLESFYTELRRCRTRCDGQPHDCKPLSASTIQQIHSIISGTLAAAERWDWINSNPARLTRRPHRKPPKPDPPTPTQASRIVEEAFRMDEDWGTLVWLAMTTGMRRGELCGLRFARVDLDAEVIDLRRNWVLGEEKDTKTHQNRRISLDSETVTMLREHRARVESRLAALDRPFTDDLFVFSNARTPDHSEPYSPNAVTQRYKDMATRLGIKTHLHALRHYSATELLTAGVDLPTVAGRLGHGGGGATTLKVYAAWVAASDRKAAEILGSRMPKRHN